MMSDGRRVTLTLVGQSMRDGRNARPVGQCDRGGHEWIPVVVEAEIGIKRSPEDVFDFCSDPSHEPEWNPMMKHAAKLTDGPIGVGARYTTEFVDAPPMVMECVHYERPSAWSFTGASGALKAAGGGRVVPTSEGAHLLMRMELEPHGLLKLATPFLRRGMTSMFQRDLDNIKAQLEREQ